MKYVKSNTQHWTIERGYYRGILLPFGNELNKDVQVQITEISPGAKVPKHHHKTQHEIMFFLEGQLNYLFEGESVIVQAGDLLIIEPGEIHATTNEFSSTCRFFSVKVHGDGGDTVWDE